jgi:hypothetical protein
MALRDDLDKVSRVTPTPEMTFPCDISSDKGLASMMLPCIVDTACGLGYLYAPSGICLRNMDSRPFSSAVLLADNKTTTSISEAVLVSITIASVKRTCLLPVLRGGDEFALLFGRSLLSLFNISTIGAKLVKMGSVVLYDSSVARASRAYDHLDKASRVISSPEMSQGVVELNLKVNSKGVPWSLSPSDQDYMDSLLHEVSQLPPQPFPCCPGRVSLNRYQSSSIADTESQRWAFVISLDDPPEFDPSEDHRLYSTAMYRKLELSDRERFCEQVEEYVRCQWWTPITRESAIPFGPPACVFAIRQKEKLRLVIDFRARNRSFPSTASQTPISFSLSLLRTLPPGSIFVADAASAFYRIHASTPAWIHCGELGDFLSHRVSFGMSYGPEALDHSLGALWKLFMLIARPGTGARYVDDVWFHTQEDIHHDTNSLLYLMDRCGFSVDQKKLQFLDTDKGEVSLFGMRIHYTDGNNLSVNCCREKLKKFIVEDLRIRPTKAKVFEICGILSYDPLRVHLEEKLISDLLRSVVGCYGDWQGPLDLNEFSAVDLQLYQAIISRIAEIVHEHDSCDHRFALPQRGSGTETLRLVTDASHSGAGFLIQIQTGEHDWSTIFADAWWHKRDELKHHSNRLEASCLFRGMRCLSKFIEYSLNSRSNSSVNRSLTLLIQTDNTSALAWAQKPPNSDGYESRAIERLSEALRAELFHLKSLCSSLKIGHIAGILNNEADKLSRYLSKFAPMVQARDRDRASRKAKPKPLMQDLRSRVPAMDVPDVVRRTSHRNEKVAAILNGHHRPYRSWIEDVAQTCYGFPNLCFMVAIARYAFRIWSCSAQKKALPACPDLYKDEDELAAIRLSQTNMVAADIANEGQLHYDPGSDIIYLQRALPTGQYQFVPYIPASSIVHSMILRDAHRKTMHMGVDFTLVQTQRFGLQRPIKRTMSLIQTCIHCQMKNASQKINGPVHMISNISDCPPFSYWAIDHVSVGNKVTALSMMCLTTGYCLFSYCSDHGYQATFQAFMNLLDRCPRGPAQVFSDKASVFSLIMGRYQQLNGVAVDHITTSGQAAFENGKLERLHRSGISVLGTKTYLEKIRVTQDSSPLMVQRLLDACAKILNNRPLGQVIDSVSSSRFILTPNVLVFGPDSIDSQSNSFDSPCSKTLRNQTLWLNSFRSIYWQRLKAASCTNQAKKSADRLHTRFVCNEPVIYVTKSKPGKLDLGVSIGHVKTVVDNRLQLSNDKWVSIHNCMKLKTIIVGSTAFDVTFVGARCSTYMDDNLFYGTIIEHQADGLVLVRWDLVNGQGWLDELLPPAELTLQEGAC